MQNLKLKPGESKLFVVESSDPKIVYGHRVKRSGDVVHKPCPTAKPNASCEYCKSKDKSVSRKRLGSSTGISVMDLHKNKKWHYRLLDEDGARKLSRVYAKYGTVENTILRMQKTRTKAKVDVVREPAMFAGMRKEDFENENQRFSLNSYIRESPLTGVKVLSDKIHSERSHKQSEAHYFVDVNWRGKQLRFYLGTRKASLKKTLSDVYERYKTLEGAEFSVWKETSKSGRSPYKAELTKPPKQAAIAIDEQTLREFLKSDEFANIVINELKRRQK